MSDRDYYQVLELSRGASADEIHAAYKRLSLKFHPDKNPDDLQAADQFKSVQEAYAVLGDDETRGEYDRFGPAFQQARAGGAGPRGFSPGGLPAGFDISGLFGHGFEFADLLGDGRAAAATGEPARARRGQDIKTAIQIPFQVAAVGGGHELPIRLDGGGGRIERLTIKIPAGINSGEVLRLKGQGGSGRGGPAGDVLVTVEVAPHPWFRREGDNLLVEVPVTPAEAVLGAAIEVPTLVEGPVVVTIPPGTSGGRKLRLKGKGVRNRKTGRHGDQLVVVRIVVPDQLSDEQRALYQRLAEGDGGSSESPRSGLWGDS